MIALIVKTYLLDVGIGMFFDRLRSNLITDPVIGRVGRYFKVLDKDDGTIVAWGMCIEETADYVVLESEFSEIMVPLENYWLVIATERQINLLDGDDMTDEELINALNRE